jgi:hypothetical protein
MMTRLRYPKGYQFLDASGFPLALGLLHYYTAGTTTPQDTYSDSAGTVLNTNPIVLDASGRLLVDIYLGSSTDYKEVLTTSSVTISPWPDDNIQAAVTIFSGDSGSGGTFGYVPAPAAGDAVANKFLKADGTWATTPAGGGGVTNLSATETSTTVSIASSSGSGATIPAATNTTAGVLDSARAAKIDGLATVATSGSYNDLSNKPTLGSFAALSSLASSSLSDKTTAGVAMFTAANAAGQAALLPAFTGDSGSGGVKGLVPSPAAGDAAANKFLKANGTWATTPAGASSSPFVGDSGSGGSAGLVPAPVAGDASKYLKGSGSFADPFNDNWTTSGNLLTNSSFTSDISGWTAAGTFAWNSGGGAAFTSTASLTQLLGGNYTAGAVYKIVVTVSSLSGTAYLQIALPSSAAKANLNANGTYTLYLESPGATSGLGVQVLAYGSGSGVLNSITMERITYTRKALTGLSIQGGGIRTSPGSADIPALHNTSSVGTAGFYWDYASSLSYAENGTRILQVGDEAGFGAGTSPVIAFKGSNRGTIESSTSLILRALSNHFEIEGDSTRGPTLPIEFIGYRGGSNQGCPIFWRTDAVNPADYTLGVRGSSVANDATAIFQVQDHNGTGNFTVTGAGIVTCAKVSATSALSSGFRSAIFSNGTIASGTLTPSLANGNEQSYTNNGAHIFSPPSVSAGERVRMCVTVTNGASAGAIDTTSFTKRDVGAYGTTSGQSFDFFLQVENGFSSIKAVARQ